MPSPPATLKAYQQAMQHALAEARMALAHGDIPVGAVVVHAGTIIAAAHNQREAQHDPCGHAELLAIRAAAQHLGTWRLNACTVVVTLEPCLMCASALVQARVGTVVFGASDPQQGGLGGRLDVRPLTPGATVETTQVLAGVNADTCTQLLTGFFNRQRKG